MKAPCKRCNGTGNALYCKLTGAKMRALRLKANLTMAEVGERMGVTEGFVCLLEKGRRHWSPERVDDYKKALK